jgi:hypothetical protein
MYTVNMILEVGRPTDLDDLLFLKIRKCALEDMGLPEMAKTLELNEDTVYGWHARNYEGFKDKWITYKHERKLQLADSVSHDILTLSPTDPEGKTDTALLSIQQKEAQFLRETLDKGNYSKRQEQTGKGGGPIEQHVTGNLVVFKDFSNGASSQ